MRALFPSLPQCGDVEGREDQAISAEVAKSIGKKLGRLADEKTDGLYLSSKAIIEAIT